MRGRTFADGLESTRLGIGHMALVVRAVDILAVPAGREGEHGADAAGNAEVLAGLLLLPGDGGGEPEGELAAVIAEFFGDYAKFQAHFAANATAIQGSGWSVLAWDSIAERLNIFQLFDQQGNVPLGIIPLLQVDMWEHAFYLQYKNVKTDYVKAFWNVVNWEDVNQRFVDARNGLNGLRVPQS